MALQHHLEPEQKHALQAAKRCAWAGVACLYALAALIVCSERMGAVLAMLRLPRVVEACAGVSFYASWLLAGVGLLWRCCELNLEARAGLPEQKKALQKVNRFRRVAALGILAAAILALYAASFLGGLAVLEVLGLAAYLCVLLHRRVDAMARRITWGSGGNASS